MVYSEVCPWTLTPTGYKGVSEDADTDGVNCHRGYFNTRIQSLIITRASSANVSSMLAYSAGDPVSLC